jgi:dipeptidyl aminopeptidase/acylaminoacyl peptidase
LLAVLLVAVAVLYAGVSLLVADRISRPLRRPLHTTPAAYGLQYEDVAFTSTEDNVPLSGWYIDTPGDRTIMILHGAGSVRDNFINMEVGRALAQQGFDIFMFDFRGHGASGGDRTSLGEWEKRDIAGAVSFLRSRGVSKVGVLGYSMGGAAALLAAPEQPEIAAVAADSAFSDLFSVVETERAHMGVPNLFNPGYVFVSKALFGVDVLENEPKRAIARLSGRPVLLIHGEEDALIPVEQAYELRDFALAAGNQDVELWVVPLANHVGAVGVAREEYVRRVAAFFDAHLAKRH